MPLPIEQSMQLYANSDVAAREFSDKKRANLVKKGKAMPGGRYPIVNKEDLGNAKRAIGRAKNPGKTKAWINKRAKELGEPGLGEDKVKAGGPGSGRRPSGKENPRGKDWDKGWRPKATPTRVENPRSKDWSRGWRPKGVSGRGPGSGRHPEGKGFVQMTRKSFNNGTHTRYGKGNKIVTVTHGHIPGRAHTTYPAPHGTFSERTGTQKEIGDFLQKRFGINHDFSQ